MTKNELKENITEILHDNNPAGGDDDFHAFEANEDLMKLVKDYAKQQVKECWQRIDGLLNKSCHRAIYEECIAPVMIKELENLEELT